MQENLRRMIELAERVFDVRNDPDQLSVNEETLGRLRRIHPATVTERADANGPFAWMLLIPATRPLMERFIAKEINERELLDLIPMPGSYDTIYLCSALVLPEFRRKGLAKELVCNSVEAIRQDHPITSLFYWPFTREGDALAQSVARQLKLPLMKRPS